ncbi:hypothetical protein [Arsenicicoccus dermatophilus]|uniref:hypothetical protein n=1 Tax=Arsenicicoccus dermatophilus TaxID=1076331 RepID=UPI0039173682
MSTIPALSALLLTLSPALGSQAHTHTLSEASDGFEVVFTGEVRTDDSGEIDSKALAQAGVDVLEAPGNADETLIPAGEPDASPELAADKRYNIVAQWKDKRGRNVVLRIGEYSLLSDRGWGLEKITRKHNLNERTTRFATARFEHEDNGAMRTVFNRAKCRKVGPIVVCKVIERQWVRTVVNFNEKPPYLPKGVITSYCEGHDGACPAWLKKVV